MRRGRKGGGEREHYDVFVLMHEEIYINQNLALTMIYSLRCNLVLLITHTMGRIEVWTVYCVVC